MTKQTSLQNPLPRGGGEGQYKPTMYFIHEVILGSTKTQLKYNLCIYSDLFLTEPLQIQRQE